MHLPPLIQDLSIILIVAGAMSFICQKLKQPVVLGYLIAGVIVGPYTPPIELIKDIPNIHTLAELGVIFLMFALGLEFSFKKLLSVGMTAVVAASLEVLFFLIVGYAIGSWGFGWSEMDSIFLGAMLSISSTTIIIKALEELKLKTHRFASLVFGILIVEDLLAILMLVGLTTIASTGDFSPVSMAEATLHLLIAVTGWFLIGYFFVPRLMTMILKNGSEEMLTLVAVGLCLFLVAIAAYFGYSAALGAFIMGSILAESRALHQIETLMSPIKNLFGAIFFVSIGMLIDPQTIWAEKEIILLLTLVTMIGKVFIIFFGSMISGQSLKNSVQVGCSLAQIGEFSFIIANLGMSLNVIDPKLYPIAVSVSLITTFFTPYLIKHSSWIAEGIEAKLPQKFKENLSGYAIWSEHRGEESQKWTSLTPMLVRFLLNGVIVTLIFNFAFEKLLNYMSEQLTWVVAFLLSTPFLWGMVFTSKKNQQKNEFNNVVAILLLPLLTFLWLVVLSANYISVFYVLVVVSLFLLGVYFALFRRLEASYKWIESKFLKTFEKKHGKFSNLAPWDYHLTQLHVDPNSKIISQTLLQANLRNRFGINIVAIQRGHRSIVAPKPSELIHPYDELVILGTDEQIDLLRLEIESEEMSKPYSQPQYLLRPFKISPESELSNRSIRESELREKYHSMVVGIERENQKMINPDTDLKILPEDIIWIVGEKEMLTLLETTISKR